MTDTRKRHCWECLRRHLVCDSTQPGCKRCYTAGVHCPGYGDVKPVKLRWLAPGRVASRSWKRNGPSPSGKSKNKDTTITTSNTMKTPEPSLLSKANHEVIPRLEMIAETWDVPQALEYYNTCIYQDLAPLYELGPNPHIYRISPTHLHSGAMAKFPEYLPLSFLCMTLSHRINRMRNGLQQNALAEVYYQYRGMNIVSLNEEINVEDRRMGDIVIAGIITLLLTDAQQGASLNWRCHLDGVDRLIKLRGGIGDLAQSRSLNAPLLCSIYVAIIGNTTCPVSDLAMTRSHVDNLDFILQHRENGIPFQMCPPPLLAEVVRVNHLRMLAATTNNHVDAGHVSQKACELLNRIHAFSADEWAKSKPSSSGDWMLAANAYQAAVSLYCIFSLQSLSILPAKSTSLRDCCSIQGQLLYHLLKEALASPRIKSFMLWPLFLLGIEAAVANGDAAGMICAFVTQQLDKMSRHNGSHVPLTAKRVLERSWASEETRWDACFDRPYAFTTQLSVDVSPLLPDGIIASKESRS